MLAEKLAFQCAPKVVQLWSWELKTLDHPLAYTILLCKKRELTWKTDTFWWAKLDFLTIKNTVSIFKFLKRPSLEYLHMTRLPCARQKYAVAPVHSPVHFQRQCLQMCNFLKDKKRRHCFSIMGSHNFSIQHPNSIFFKTSHSAEPTFRVFASYCFKA